MTTVVDTEPENTSHLDRLEDGPLNALRQRLHTKCGLIHNQIVAIKAKSDLGWEDRRLLAVLLTREERLRAQNGQVKAEQRRRSNDHALTGVSLRDQVAAHVFAGLVGRIHSTIPYEALASDSFDAADAWTRVRRERSVKPPTGGPAS